MNYLTTFHSADRSLAALLPSLRSGITIVLCTVLLPGLTKYLSKHILSPALKDLLLSKASILLLLLGNLVLSTSATPALMILGQDAPRQDTADYDAR